MRGCLWDLIFFEKTKGSYFHIILTSRVFFENLCLCYDELLNCLRKLFGKRWVSLLPLPQDIEYIGKILIFCIV